MKLLLIVSPVLVLSEFVAMKYDHSLVAAISDQTVWQDLHTEVLGKAQLVTSEYYDTKIVSRWTSEWLAGDTTWIIGFTQD